MARLLFPKSIYSLLGSLAAIFNAGIRVALAPLLVTPLIDQVFNQGKLEILSEVLWLGFGLIVFGSLMLFLQDGFFGHLAAITSAKEKKRLFKNLLKRPVDSLPASSGGLSSRIINDIKDLEIFLQYGLGSLIAESFTLFGIFIVLFRTDSFASLSLLILLIPLILVLAYSGNRLERSTIKSQASTEQLGSQLQEGFKHHNIIRAFLADKFILNRFKHSNQKTRALMTKRSLLAASQTPLAQVLIFIALGILVYILGQKVLGDSMTLGQMISYLTLVMLASTPAQLLPRAYAYYKQAKAASTRLNELYIEQEFITGKENIDDIRLELNQLSYNYNNLEILKNINLVFEENSLVVIKGESGTGKTTLLKLLLGFAQPRGGEVLLGSQRVIDIDETILRQELGYVPQASELLSLSIKDNISLGRNISEEKIWRALQEVKLKTLVETWGDGLEHKLSEDGAGISGGERQRLAIARAIVNNPKIILLDEPSANLDDDNEKALVEVLKQQAKQRLLIVASHSETIAQAADYVYELENKALKRL